MILLNGKFVTAEEVDPTQHRFIGLFRQPNPPNTRLPNGTYADRIACPCGHHIESMEGVRQHWQQGHFDIPQYINIEKDP